MLIILLILVNVVFFVLPVKHTAALWLADMFAMIAIGMQVIIHYIAYSKAKNLTSKVFGFPVVRVGYLYLMAQLLVSLITVLLSRWIPVWLIVLLGIVLLAVAAIGVIGADNARNVIEAMENSHQEQVVFMRTFTEKIRSQSALVQDVSVVTEFQKLLEELRYSDPVSSQELTAIENSMEECEQLLENAIRDDNSQEVLKQIKQLRNLLVNRNQECKLSKKRVTDRGSL